jgi:hypothetical protein
MTDLRYERIPPDSECVTPDGHSYIEEMTVASRIPDAIFCPRCGDPWTIVVFERRKPA